MLNKITDPVSESEAKFVFAHCEALGEESARKAIAGRFFVPELQKHAELWLRLQDERRQDNFNRAIRRSAFRTEVAAWLAAGFAFIAVLPLLWSLFA